MTSRRAKRMPSKLPNPINTDDKLPKSIQTRNKDKILTRVLAVENKERKRTPQKREKKKVSAKKVEHLTLADTEFYPDKLKRNMSSKKIVLKPKHDMKVIACTNKRKLNTPQKGYTVDEDLEPCHSTSCMEMSMYDAVRYADESMSLSDEDLMEILTCPSPVWWEEPPDPDYTEDPICRLSPTQKSSIYTHTDLKKDDTIQTDCNKNTSEQFTQKKRKLEDVLGNIKKVTQKVAERSRRLSESTEGDIFSDISMNEEDILRDLENIDIPIEESNAQTVECSGKQNGDDVENSIGMVVPKTEVDDSPVVQDSVIKVASIKRRKSRKSPVNVKRETDSDVKRQSDSPPKSKMDDAGSATTENSFSEMQINDNDISSKPSHDRESCIKKTGFIKIKEDLLESEIVPANMPQLKRKPVIKKVAASKKVTIKNESNTTTNEDYYSSSNLADSMSTEVDPKSSNDQIMNDSSQYITVYKIMSAGDVNMDSDAPKKSDSVVTKKTDNGVGHLNSFFKKCKSSKRIRKDCTTVEGDINNVVLQRSACI